MPLPDPSNVPPPLPPPTLSCIPVMAHRSKYMVRGWEGNTPKAEPPTSPRTELKLVLSVLKFTKVGVMPSTVRRAEDWEEKEFKGGAKPTKGVEMEAVRDGTANPKGLMSTGKGLALRESEKKRRPNLMQEEEGGKSSARA